MRIKAFISTMLMSASVVAIGGCGSIPFFSRDKDNVDPPAELVAFEPRITVQQLWSKDIGAGSKKEYLKLTPAVAYDKVFAVDAVGRVSAYDVVSGQRVWENETKTHISGGPGTGDGLVYVGTIDAEVLALDAETGETRWRSGVSSEVLAPPRADGGVVVVRAVDGKIFGLSTDNGERLWVHEHPVPVLTLRGAAAPVLTDGAVLVGFADGKLTALTLREGRMLWETQVAVPRGRSDLERMVDVDAEPLVGDGVVHVVSYQGNVATLELRSGQVYWQRDMSSHAGIGMDENYLYVSDEQSHVWSLDRRSSATFWKQDKLHARAVTAPVPQGDYVVVGDLEGYLHWLAKADGSFAARVRVDKSRIQAPPVVVGDTLYVMSNEGTLAAYRVEG